MIRKISIVLSLAVIANINTAFAFANRMTNTYDNKIINQISKDKHLNNINCMIKLCDTGFDDKGINTDTGTKYDKDGFDCNGFNKDRINKNTGSYYDENGYDENGFDKGKINIYWNKI